MPIDPRIALGVQQSTFDPAAAIQNAFAIRNARLQEQANQLKLQQEQQAMQETAGLQSYLAQNPDLTSADVQNRLVSQYGQKGLDILNTQQELANRRLQGKTQELAYDKAHHERIDQLIGDVTRYTTADQANSALDSMLEKGEIDPQTHSMYRNIVVSTPWPQAKTQILGGLRTIQEQFESMQPQAPMSPVGKAQADLAAAIARGDTEAAARLRDYISKETTHAPSAKTTSIVNLPPAQTAEQTEHGKQLVSTYGDIKALATTARNQRTTVDIMDKLLTEGFETGFGKEATAKAANVLTSLGVKDAAKYAADAQSFQAAVRQNVLDEQMKQKGVQTEGDAQRIEETSARLGNTTEANKFLVAVRRAQQDRAMAQQKFWDNWWTKNKTYEGAEQAWNEGEGGKSIFDTPALKKYAPTGITKSNW